MGLERCEKRVDLRIVCHIAWKDQLAAEFGSELGDAVFEAFADVGERELGAFAFARLRDAISNRAIRQQTSQQNAFSSEKAHELS